MLKYTRAWFFYSGIGGNVSYRVGSTMISRKLLVVTDTLDEIGIILTHQKEGTQRKILEIGRVQVRR